MWFPGNNPGFLWLITEEFSSRLLGTSSLPTLWFRVVREAFGGYGGGETPGPIPNPEVKPFSADGTAWETVWESRTPPDIY